ncbi:MAG: DUF4825 domain-containing protein [Lachnospiraceae bacterium]|nr:DUF4825 domain-containing protein [Lachnospiraceae bacterium]
MKNSIPCLIIRELFPSYIEGLTSEETNGYIEEHVEECNDCKKVLESMKEPMENGNGSVCRDNEEKKEIDFLKKTRSRYNKKIIISVAVLAVVLISVFAAKVFFVGKSVGAEHLNYNLGVVKGVVAFEGSTYDSKIGIKDVEFKQKGDTVTIDVKSVRKSIIYSDYFQESFEATNEIKRVLINDKVVWANGVEISPITDELFKVKNEYIGDHSADGAIARVLDLQSILGDYQVELKTDKQPYELKIICPGSYIEFGRKNIDEYFKKYAYIMLAEIDNMDIMSVEYNLDESNKKTVSVTKEEASEYFGRNIKEAGRKIEILQELVEKTELEKMQRAFKAVYENDDEGTDNDSIKISVVNLSDTPIYGYGYGAYVGDEIMSSGGVSNANGSAIAKNSIESFEFEKGDFDVMEDWSDMKDAKVSISVMDKNNKEHEVGTVEINPANNRIMTVIIKSDKDGNYYMENE